MVYFTFLTFSKMIYAKVFCTSLPCHSLVTVVTVHALLSRIEYLFYSFFSSLNFPLALMEIYTSPVRTGSLPWWQGRGTDSFVQSAKLQYVSSRLLFFEARNSHRASASDFLSMDIIGSAASISASVSLLIFASTCSGREHWAWKQDKASK